MWINVEIDIAETLMRRRQPDHFVRVGHRGQRKDVELVSEGCQVLLLAWVLLGGVLPRLADATRLQGDAIYSQLTSRGGAS